MTINVYFNVKNLICAQVKEEADDDIFIEYCDVRPNTSSQFKSGKIELKDNIRGDRFEYESEEIIVYNSNSSDRDYSFDFMKSDLKCDIENVTTGEISSDDNNSDDESNADDCVLQLEMDKKEKESIDILSACDIRPSIDNIKAEVKVIKPSVDDLSDISEDKLIKGDEKEAYDLSDISNDE